MSVLQMRHIEPGSCPGARTVSGHHIGGSSQEINLGVGYLDMLQHTSRVSGGSRRSPQRTETDSPGDCGRPRSQFSAMGNTGSGEDADSRRSRDAQQRRRGTAGPRRRKIVRHHGIRSRRPLQDQGRGVARSGRPGAVGSAREREFGVHMRVIVSGTFGANITHAKD